MDAAHPGRGKVDGVPCPPGEPVGGRGVTEGHRLPTRDRDLLQLALGGEGDPCPVGGEDGAVPSFRAGQGRGVELIHPPQMKLGPASAPGDVDDRGPVGRDGHRRLPVDGQGRRRGKVDVEPGRRPLAGAGDQDRHHGEDDRRAQGETAPGQGTLGDAPSQAPPTSPALAAGRELREGFLDLDPGVRDVVEPLVPVLAQAAPEEIANAERRPPGQGLPVGIALEDGGDGVGARGSLECLATRERLVEDAAERPHVALAVGGPSPHRLGAHVVEGAHESGPASRRIVALEREGRGGAPRDVRHRPLGAGALREPEVEHLDHPRGGDLHVRGLEVPVHDAPRVGGFDGVRDLAAQVEGPDEGQGARLQQLGQGLPRHQLEDEVGHPVAIVDRVEGRDVGVVQGRHHARLPLEAGQVLGAVGQPGGQHLDRDVASEPRVAGLIDLAHAADAQRAEHLERTETCAGGKRGAGRREGGVRGHRATESQLTSLFLESQPCLRADCDAGHRSPLPGRTWAGLTSSFLGGGSLFCPPRRPRRQALAGRPIPPICGSTARAAWSTSISWRSWW